MESSEIFLRQLDLFDPLNFNGRVTIVGAGAIGSSVALMLTKLGIKRIKIIDFDSVEPHNQPNQIFFAGDTGKTKVEAAKNMMMAFNPSSYPMNIMTSNRRATSKDKFRSEIIILAMDSKEARLDVVKAITDDQNTPVQMIIDARMGGESMRVYSAFPHNEESMAYYMRSFDGGVSELPCTARSIIYNLFVISGFVGSCISHYARRESPPPRVIFDIHNFAMVKTEPIQVF